MVRNPLVSVIIPTKDSGATIEKCLRSVRDQTYQSIEIIVVDGFSSDGTRKIAASYGAKVFETFARRSEARNIGAEKSRGKLLFFVDSDMELDSSMVDECLIKVGEGYCGIIIPETSVGEGFWSKCKAVEKSCYVGDETIEAPRFFAKTAFKDIGGYDVELEAGEDWDLGLRIRKAGFNVGRVRALIKHHETEPNLWRAMKRKYRYGKTIEKYRIRHPRESQAQLTLIRPAFLRNLRRLAKEPTTLIGLLFLKFCEFGAGALGSMVAKTEEHKTDGHQSPKFLGS